MKFSFAASLLGLLIAAPISGYAQTASVEAWKQALATHLASHRMHSPNGQSGSARVLFVLDRSGKLISRVLVESTGSHALDMAALALVERSDPFPTPPPEIEDNELRLIVPVVFEGYKFQPSQVDDRGLQAWIEQQTRENAKTPRSEQDDTKLNSMLHGVCRRC